MPCRTQNGKQICTRTDWWRESMGIDWYSGSGGSQPPELSETDENIAFSLRFDWMSTMLQEGGGADGVPLTSVDADAQTVGTVYDMSKNAMILRTEAVDTQPVLGSDANVSSFVTFDGTNDKLTVLSSKALFKTMWSANPVFGFMFAIKFGNDGAVGRIFSSDDGLATNTGLTIVRTSGNQIIARVPYSVSPNFVWAVTSTSTIMAADGWRVIAISCNGVGAATGRFVIADLDGNLIEDKTFAVTGNGVAANGTYNLNIGATEGGAGFLNGSLGKVKVLDRALTTADITTFATTLNTARQTTFFKAILQYKYDLNDTDFIFSDTGGTTPAVNDDPVRLVKNNQLGNFGHSAESLRSMSSAAAGSSPLWKAAAVNSRGGLLFDGVDDNMDFLNLLMEEKGGKNTLFLVFSNEDATFGSQPLKGEDYVVLTGKDYTGMAFANPYFVVHNNFPNSVGIGSKGAGVDGFKVMAYRRDQEDIAIWNGSKEKNTGTSDSECYFTDMGQFHSGTTSDWWMDGHVAYLLKYNGAMTDAEVTAKIDELNTLFAL